MRYADGGGLTAAGRQRREAVRRQAAKLLEQKIKPLEVAQRLRVSRKSAYRWHQLWRDGGIEALVSHRPSGSRCRLSPRCLEKLAAYLEQGPNAHGWVEDQVMHRRMLGNGSCARPVEMDCHFESICESCTFFVTTIEFRPTLQRQRDNAAAKRQVAREQIFDGLLSRLDEDAS